MMRMTFSICMFVFFGVLPIVRSEEKITEEGSFVRRETNEEEQNEDIPVSKTNPPNFRIEKLAEPRDISFITKNMAAWKVAASGYSIRWSPLWAYEGVGTVRISAAAMSSDKSLIVIAETTGPADGPNGSLVIFMETREWSFIRYLKLDDEKITSMFFLPGTARLLCRFARQAELKKPYRLAVINPRNGKIFSETKLPVGEISDMITNKSGSMLFVKPADTADMLLFDTGDLSKEPLAFNSDINDEKASLSLSPDNASLLVCGDGKIKVFDMEFKRFKKDSLALPDDVKNGNVFFTGAARDFVFLVPGKDAYLYRDKTFRKIMDNAGRSAYPFSQDNKNFIAIEGEKNMAINIFAVPECEPVISIPTSKIKPYTSGSVFFWGVLDRRNSFFVLDDIGEFMEIKNPKNAKKWKKNLIFKPAR